MVLAQIWFLICSVAVFVFFNPPEPLEQHYLHDLQSYDSQIKSVL